MSPAPTAEPLSTRARGLVLATVNALGPVGAARFLERRSAQLAAHARALADATLRDRETSALDRAVVEGLDQVHPSWYVPPPPSRRPEAARHLGHLAYGHLVAMAPAAAGGVDRMLAPALDALLLALGRTRVATAFVGAPRAGVAQLCARLGEPAGSELLAALLARRAAAPSSDEIRAAQAAVHRSEVRSERRADSARADNDRGRDLFLRVGAGALAAALAGDGDRLQRVAQRLPRPLGQLLLDEVAAPLPEAERRLARALVANALERGL